MTRIRTYQDNAELLRHCWPCDGEGFDSAQSVAGAGEAVVVGAATLDTVDADAIAEARGISTEPKASTISIALLIYFKQPTMLKYF